MNVEDAAHQIGLEYEGGAEALAVRMGIGGKVFSGKILPSDKFHVLSVSEAVRMQQLTGRYGILHAMAESLNHVCVERPSFESKDISEATSKVCVEFGHFLSEVTGTVKDKKVTRNELKRMQKELVELIAAATSLHSLVASKAR